MTGDLFTFAAARHQRDRGLAQAERHAPAFAEAAYAAIVRAARMQPTVHIDDVLCQNVPTPHHHNAWGAVWARAIRDRVIVATERRAPCKRDPKKHAHQYPVYRSLVWGRR